MKTHQLLYVIFMVSVLFSSCLQEEINPISENVNTLVLENTALKSKTIPYKAPLAVASLSPCGYGFNVSVTFAGNPIAGSYAYTIRDMGNNLVDSGSISDGMSTPWVLSGCTDYQFEFWGSWGCPTCSVIQIATADGCGGLFLC